MIFAATLAKLAAKKATVFRVDVAPATYMGRAIPGCSEHFATLAAAEKYVAQYTLYTTATITPVGADTLNPFLTW